MNDENQENEALKGPVILTVPASITVPGFGFLIALNPHWCFEGIKSGDDSLLTRPRQACQSVSKVSNAVPRKVQDLLNNGLPKQSYDRVFPARPIDGKMPAC
jgi:hypothetical protein